MLVELVLCPTTVVGAAFGSVQENKAKQTSKERRNIKEKIVFKVVREILVHCTYNK